MAITEAESGQVCPYFSKEMNACRLCEDGIYLPPKVHVLTYCLTPMHKECSIYTRFCPMETIGSQSSEGRGGKRRRFKRVNEQRKVLLRTSSPQGIVVGEFAEMALTLDYSQGGMRIAIDKEIPADSLLLFDFDDDFLIPRLQGLAQLRWHRRLDKNTHPIEAGLVFRDEYSQKILAFAMEDQVHANG